MKIVIYSDDQDLLGVANGLQRDPPIASMTDYDQIVAALEQGENAVLFLDYDTDKKVAKKLNEHFANCLAVKRVVVSGKMSVREFKKMQKKEHSADGYYQKPLDAKTLQGIIDDYELIFQMNADDGTEVAPSEGEETKIGKMLFGDLSQTNLAGIETVKGDPGAQDAAAPAEDKAAAAPAEDKDAASPAAGPDLELKSEEEPGTAEMDFTATSQVAPAAQDAKTPAAETAAAPTLDLSNEEMANPEEGVGVDAALAEAGPANASTAVIGQDELAKLKAMQDAQDPGPAAEAGNADLELQTANPHEESFVAEGAAPAPAAAEDASASGLSLNLDLGNDTPAPELAVAEAPTEAAPATEVELNDEVSFNDGGGVDVDADLQVDEDASLTDLPNLPENDISFAEGGDASGAIDIDAELAQAAAEGDYDPTAPADDALAGYDDQAAIESPTSAAAEHDLDQAVEQDLDLDPLAPAAGDYADDDAAYASGEDVVQQMAAPAAAPDIPNPTDESFSIDPTSYAKLQGTIRHLREERNAFLDKISKLENERQQALSDKLGVEAELEELKIELSIIKKRNADELQEYKYRMRSAEEKKEIFSQKNRTMQRELESLRQQVRVDVNKIKERERQLEGQLELAQMDAAGQIEGRDQKILELKRKIDALEFNMENLAFQQQRAKEDKSKLQDKMNKMMAALRGSIRLMEEDMEVDQVLQEQYRKRA